MNFYKLTAKGYNDLYGEEQEIKHRIIKNSFPYYPRILTDNHSGRDLRIILGNNE